MPTLPWNIDLTPAQPGLSLETTHDFETGETILSVTNSGDSPLRPETLEFTSALPLKASGSTLWLHGRSAKDDALVRVLGEAEESGYTGSYREALDDGTRYRSSEVVVLSVPAQGQPSLVVGCIEPGRFFFDVRIDASAGEFDLKQITLSFDLESAIELAPGETLTLPAIHVREGGEPLGLIEGFAEAAAEKLGARIPATPPTGLRLASTPSTLTKGSTSGTYVVVPKSDDPAGDATRIRGAGFEAGVTFSPLTAAEGSAILAEHPELFLKTSSGDLYLADSPARRVAVLDCTNTASAEWLAAAVRALVDEGNSYLELESLGSAAVAADLVVYTESSTTGPANLRRGLEIIREAAGEGVFLLAADCPFGPALGLVDGIRTSPATDGSWPEVRRAMGLALQRSWMNGRWWANDAGSLTAGVSGAQLSDAEVRFLATGIALSGGAAFAADDAQAIPLEQREMLMSLIPATGVAAKPDDPGDGPVPFAWRVTLEDGRSLIGLLNNSDHATWVAQSQFLSPGEVAFNAWDGSLAGMGDIRVNPHDGLLFQVSLPGRGARVTGDSGHIGMADLAQREVSARVQVRNDRSYPRTIAVSARRNTTVYTLKPGEYRWFD